MNSTTTRKRHDDGDTPFGAWMRHHPQLDSRLYHLDIENIDYAVFEYMQGLLMLLEEKRGFNNFPTDAQVDTHSIIDQALRFAFSHPDFAVERVYPDRTQNIVYYGYFLVQFERTNPDDGEIRVNNIPVSKDQLLQFLKFQWTLPRYRRVYKYRNQLQRILACNTLEALKQAQRYTAKTVDREHPETDVLRAAWKAQVHKVIGDVI